MPFTTRHSSNGLSANGFSPVNQRGRQPFTLVLSLLLVISWVSKGQDTAEKAGSKPSINQQQLDTNRSPPRYQTSLTGWIIRPGDTLQLGQGSLPTKAFAFLHQYDSTRITTSTNRLALGTEYSGRKVLLTQLRPGEPPEAGSRVYGLINPGRPPYYQVDLDSAINGGEILPPIQYRPSAQASPAVPVRAGDELIKLKALLDAGRITKPEYTRRRAIILGKK